jgi:hypothetical protein
MTGTDITNLVKVTFVHMVCADCNEIFGSLVVPYDKSCTSTKSMRNIKSFVLWCH